MDATQAMRWVAVPTAVPPVEAGELLALALAARPLGGCLTARQDPAGLGAHGAACGACRAWEALGRPAPLAAADAAQWLCARARTLACTEPWGTPMWVVAQAHVAGCAECREWLLAGLTWRDCGAVRERLAASCWELGVVSVVQPRRRLPRMAREEYANWEGEGLVNHLRRCLPCRHWCWTQASCGTVATAVQLHASSALVNHRDSDWIDPKIGRCWDYLNPLHVAHLQLCQGCQQQVAAYRHRPALTWLFVVLTEFWLPFATEWDDPLDDLGRRWRASQLATASRQALAHRAVLGRWQPPAEDAGAVVPLPPPRAA